MKYKYFNYKEIFNCHSIFYYAVSNKMFDLAAKLYSQYSNFFDINENGLLVDNCTDPEIVEFLIGYHELCVNNKNSNHQTSIDILTSISSVDQSERIKSISYLLKRPDIQINPTKIILNSLKYEDNDLFELITNYCLEHKIKISDDVLSQIIENENNNFIIHLIKNKMISIDQDNLYQICIKSQNTDIIHNILNDKIPQGQEISALVYSINCDNKDYFHYLLDIITADFKGINDFIPESNETLLTYSIKETENLFFLKELLTNKKIDINKQNKLGESPFLLAIKIGYDKSILKLFISNKNTKIKIDDFKIVYNSFRPICTDIIYNIKHFDDDPQLLIDYIIENKNNDLINDILNPPSIKCNKQKEKKKRKIETDYDEDYDEELNFNYMKEGDWKYFEKIKKTVFIPAIISYYLQNNNQDLLSTFQIIKSELKHDKIVQEKIKYYLCKSLFNNQFNESIIEYYKMFFVNQQKDDSNKLTLFGNVRTKEIAQKLIKMLNKQNFPIENIIMEVGGLNILGKTAFYTSIEENNSSLFKYILNLSKEINTKLSKQKKKSSDLIICAKNKDGSNPFYAACLKDKKDTFLNPLVDKMIQLNSSDYFGKYGPLRAAFLNNDLELVDLLISKGFMIDHYAFCQILKSKKYDLFKKKYLKNIKDFKFNLFMPLYLINDEKELHKIFTKDMINYDFVPEGYEDEFDNYLLISSIRDSNEKLVQLILNNCDKNKIMFHWQDINGKTALHYAIEKSMTNIVYLLIDEYTSTKSKLKCQFDINQTENNNDLIYPEKDVFSHFFIEDKEKQNPIHYLFKSLNIDYIVYFYKHASAFMKSTNKTNLIYNIFNAQILSYEKIENYVVNDYALKPNNQNKIHHRKRKIMRYIDYDSDYDYGSDVENDYEYYSYESSDTKIEETKSNFKSVIVKLEGQTLLTYSILSKNSKFIDNILVNIPEIDPNRTNKNGEFPLLLAIQNDNLNILESIINSSKNSKIPIDINKSGIVFSILEMTSNETINFCLKKLMKIKNFDFNQKKIVHNDKKSKEKYT